MRAARDAAAVRDAAALAGASIFDGMNASDSTDASNGSMSDADEGGAEHDRTEDCTAREPAGEAWDFLQGTTAATSTGWC
eukprot:COSAG01_NODE_372_length_17995_cov_16.957812_14_plen_80_part_00